MEKIQKCDVLIIGAGPAGASLALYLAEAGVNVILVDKKTKIDDPVRCAEYVPAAVSRLFKKPIAGISCKVAAMDTYIDYKYVNTISSPGLMLDRPVFIESLISSFTSNGGKLLQGTSAISFKAASSSGSSGDGPSKSGADFSQEIHTRITQRPGNGSEKDQAAIVSKIVVGADGPNSIVGRHIGSTNHSYFPGLAENIPVEAKDKKKTLIFFSPEIEGGYGWLFPKKDSINLGIGRQSINKNRDLKSLYNGFKKKINSMGLLRSTGNLMPEGKMAAGLIPSSGMLKRTVSGNFILAGDAAGLTNPITGAGIYNAILSSSIVSGIIVSALQSGDMGSLTMIENKYRNTFGISLDRAVKKRKMLMSEWSSTTEDKISFGELVRQSWVSFKPYWKK